MAMRLNLRSRTLLSFVLVIAAFCVIGGVGGAIFINHTAIEEEQRRVGGDLRSAWSVVDSRISGLSTLLSALATGKRVAGARLDPEKESARMSLEAVRIQFGLDFLTLTDGQGRVNLRTVEPFHTGDDLSTDPFVRGALRGKDVSGFYVLSQRRLQMEGADLPERAFMPFEPTPKAKLRAKSVETSGLAIIASAPVTDAGGKVLGTIYGGTLLNRNNGLVDRIRSIVFSDKLIDGRPIGTVTVFQWDVRIATNVFLPNGNRALGTRVSTEVYDKVLENTGSWSGRAFVVDDWYISAYDAIRDVEDKVVGMLYVGVLAKKYDDIKWNLWKIFGGLSLVAVVLVTLVGLVFARRLTRSVHLLAEASGKVAAGDLKLTVPEPKANDELRDLTRAFNYMTANLRDREEKLESARSELNRTNASLQAVNRNYMDMLRFVSHELKNTLGVIFTSARALDSGLAGALNDKQKTLVNGIARNVETAVNMTRKYLDLTRIEQGELHLQMQQLDLLADVIDPVLAEMNQAVAEQRAEVVKNFSPSSAPLVGDATLLRVVYKNLLDNALKYGCTGGEIDLGLSRTPAGYQLEVLNQGQGLAPEKIKKLFGKFVRLNGSKESARKGTGLGLFITKQILLKHGGDIWADSQEGKWTKFTFTLPFRPPQATEAGAAQGKLSPSAPVPEAEEGRA